MSLRLLLRLFGRLVARLRAGAGAGALGVRGAGARLGSGVEVLVPAAALQHEARRRDHALQLPTAGLALGLRLLRHALHVLELLAALPALVFVDRHRSRRSAYHETAALTPDFLGYSPPSPRGGPGSCPSFRCSSRSTTT